MRLAILLSAIIFCSAIQVSAQYTFTKDNSQEFVQEFIRTGLIERVDMSRLRVYVNEAAWVYQLNAENKEMLVCLIADYFKYHHPNWDVDARPNAEIFSNRSAKRLARWSNWSGVRIE